MSDRQRNNGNTGMQIEYRVDGPIGYIVLRNPPVNALTHPRFADSAELRAFLASPDMKGAILSGAGRHFCAGADI